MFHVAHRFQQRAVEDARRGLPDGLVAILGNGVVCGQGRSVAGTALGKDLVEHAEQAPRAVELTLDQGNVGQHALGRAPVPVLPQRGEARANALLDPRQARIRRLEMARRRRVGHVLRAQPDKGVVDPRQPRQPGRQPGDLGLQKAVQIHGRLRQPCLLRLNACGW
ncbi:hypothetical protein D3C72_1713950 [compost metagenome]